MDTWLICVSIPRIYRIYFLRIYRIYFAGFRIYFVSISGVSNRIYRIYSYLFRIYFAETLVRKRQVWIAEQRVTQSSSHPHRPRSL